MQLQIKPIWVDDDTLMQVRISLAGNGHQSWCETYCYPEEFGEFGRALIEFPCAISDEARLEFGSTDPGFGDHLLIRAFVHNGAGHCAVEFKAETRGNDLVASSVRFSVPTEAASLHEMGRKIVSWSLSPNASFEFEGAGS